MSKSKQKGTAAESAVVRYLREHGFPFAERRALSGAADRGDIGGVPSVVIEVKDCVRMELSQWLKEAKAEAENAGVDVFVCWHKKRGTTDPGEWFVTMPGRVFTELVK